MLNVFLHIFFLNLILMLGALIKLRSLIAVKTFIYIFYLSFNRELVKFDFMNCTARFAIEILLFK